MLYWIEAIREIIEIYPILSVIILSFLGTEAIIFMGFLAGAGYFSLPIGIIFIVGSIAVIILDYIYYKVGQIEFLKHISPKRLNKKKYNYFFNFIKKKTHDNVFLILLISKFFYGFRQMATIYFGYHRLKYKEFIKKDSSAVLIYFIIMLTIAWLIGRQVQASFSDIEQVEKILMIGIACLVFIYLIIKVTLSKIAKKFS